MHLLFYLFFLICFVKMQAHSTSPSLEAADQYFEATLFDKAIPLYEDLLQSGHAECQKEELILRLAKSHFYLENYNEAIDILASNFLKNSSPSEFDVKVYSEGLYLLGLASKKAGFPDIFFSAMEKYISSNPQKNLPFLPAAHFTLGSAYDEQQNWSEAKKHFAQIKSGDKSFPGLYEKAQIALAKIEKKEGHCEEGKKILENLTVPFSEADPLRYELQFLKGEAALVLEDPLLAVNAFELAIPKTTDLKAPWKGDAFFRLGQCYLLLAEGDLIPSLEKQLYFDRSEHYLKKHLSTDPKEEGFLTLGKLYLTKGRLLDDPKAFSKAQEVLSQTERFSNPDNLSLSLLLRTKLPLPYRDLDLIYRELTNEAKSGSNLYPQGWYLRGANDYKHGIALLEQGEVQEARRFLEQSAELFEKAFQLLKEKEQPLALQAVYCLVQALFKIDTHPSYLKSFNCLNQILASEEESIGDSNDGELKYWHALAASQLAGKENKPEFLEIAQASLNEILEKFPEGKNREKSMHLLGLLQYKKNEEGAEKTFLKLCEIYPESPLIPEALFYAARCADRDAKGTERARNYRKQVYESFPNSNFAPESYFFYFPFQDYLAGNKEAILHLKQFIQKYGESPLVLTAFYLLGMNYKKDTKTPEGKWINKKNLNQAIEYFQDVESLFDCLIQKRAIPEDELRYYIKIRYQAALERALANQSIADEASGAKKQIFLEYATEVLESVVSDFQDKEHPLTKHLSQSEPFPRILEEANYHLAETYAKLQEDEKGEQILEGMLEKYQSAKITRGYYLSRTFYELGMIETRRRDWQAALDFFAKAEDAAKGKVLNADQKIDLWIQQSLCYRGMGQIDTAMLILSKAINDDAISSLRLKAMFIRADIYASQGKNELAKKQLEAISKKGGHWALKAKQKLDGDYDP